LLRAAIYWSFFEASSKTVQSSRSAWPRAAGLRSSPLHVVLSKARLRADIQRLLLQPAYAQLPNIVANRAMIISRVMEIAEKNNDIILYAE
jgi:hypothetical protein